METLSVTHIRLIVEEYTACFRFYRDILKLEPTFGDADSGYADFETGGVTLALFAAEEMTDALDETSPSGAGRDRACVVLRVKDVDETAMGLQAEGAELVADPTDHPEWRIRTAHARDPGETLVEFNEPLDT